MLDVHVEEAVQYNPYKLFHRVYVDGHVFEFRFKKEPVFEAARCLSDLGYDPETVLRPLRNGRPGFKPSTLEKFAKLSVTEPDSSSVSIIPWQPDPRFAAA